MIARIFDLWFEWIWRWLLCIVRVRSQMWSDMRRCYMAHGMRWINICCWTAPVAPWSSWREYRCYEWKKNRIQIVNISILMPLKATWIHLMFSNIFFFALNSILTGRRCDTVMWIHERCQFGAVMVRCHEQITLILVCWIGSGWLCSGRQTLKIKLIRIAFAVHLRHNVFIIIIPENIISKWSTRNLSIDLWNIFR